MPNEYLRGLGTLVLDHRLRRLMELLLQNAEAVYQELGLPFRARWTSTFLLLEQSGPLGVVAIAEKIGLTHPAAIGLTNEMAAGGLLVEVANARDQRRRLLALSPEAKQLAPKLHKIWKTLAAVQRWRFADAGCDIVPVLDAIEEGIQKRSISEEVVSRLKRGATLVLAVLTLNFAAIADARAQDDTVPMPGRRVDVSGYSLHLHCTGSGSPTVVLIHGFNDYSFVWQLVQPYVSKFTRVCSYDRAGQAWSDPGPAPRGLQRITNELFALLQAAGIKGPYVLVGHSWGGLIPRIFVHDHSRATAGAVFADASHEDNFLGIRDTTVQPRFVPDSVWQRIWAPSERKVGEPPPSFQPRALTNVPAPFDRLPSEAQTQFKWARSRPVFYQNGDWEDIREDMRLVAARASARAFAAKPIIVLSASRRADPAEDGITSEQRRMQFERGQHHLASLSSNSRHIVVEHTGHHIHVEEPDVVIEAIKQVVDAVRSRRKLCCQK